MRDTLGPRVPLTRLRTFFLPGCRRIPIARRIGALHLIYGSCGVTGISRIIPYRAVALSFLPCGMAIEGSAATPITSGAVSGEDAGSRSAASIRVHADSGSLGRGLGPMRTER